MTASRFAVGQNVRLHGAYNRQPQDSYVVAAVMPFDGQAVQYRIKSPHEQFFRVAKEFELTEDNSAKALFK
jgi:hypothetical protein